MKRATKSLKVGDKVRWQTSQGETDGTVEAKVVRPTAIKGFKSTPSPQNPEFKVKSSKSGKKAIHKKGALKKVANVAPGKKKAPSRPR